MQVDLTFSISILFSLLKFSKQSFKELKSLNSLALHKGLDTQTFKSAFGHTSPSPPHFLGHPYPPPPSKGMIFKKYDIEVNIQCMNLEGVDLFLYVFFCMITGPHFPVIQVTL